METIFDEHPSLDLCYQTADGTYFYLDADAANHAKRLKDKSVKKLQRSPKPLELKKAPDGFDEKEVAQKVKELQDLDLAAADYQQLTALVHYFELKVDSKKAADYIKALEAYKQKISE